MPKFSEIPQFTSRGRYEVTIPWRDLVHVLDGYSKDFNIDLNPDFQRGHVWTKEQQMRYVEFILRGGHGGRVILFNHPGWMKTFEGDMVLVDGKQRLEAVTKFLNNQMNAFGFLYCDYEDKLNFTDHYFLFNVNNLKTRKEVLQYYLDFNSGGTVHTQEELDKVWTLLEKEE